MFLLLAAEREHLTYYDACYLWLARELGAELITLVSQPKAECQPILESAGTLSWQTLARA